jgi:hypothetical protein
VALLGCAAVVLGSCSTPVSVRRVGPQTVHRELTQSVLTTGYLSGPTRNTLCDWNLDALFEDDPAAALAELHAAVVKGHGGPAEIFALAELSFAHAEYEGSRENYLAASIYAYAFLFPGGAGKPPSPFDPRLRLAADLYNRGLTSGFGSDDGEEVVLRPGVFQLPFGELEVRFDEADLRWGDRKLVQFVPVAELEVRGMKERYRRTGIGAPLAAGTAPFTPDQKLRDFVGDTTKVPVTALLRIDDPRRGLGSGRLRAELRLYDAYHVAVVEIDGRKCRSRSSPPPASPTRSAARGSGTGSWAASSAATSCGASSAMSC